MDNFKKRFTELVDKYSPLGFYEQLHNIRTDLTRGVIAGGKITRDHFDSFNYMVEILETNIHEITSNTRKDTEDYVERSYEFFLECFGPDDLGLDPEHWESMWDDFKNVFYEVTGCLSAFHHTAPPASNNNDRGSFLSQTDLLRKLMDCIEPQKPGKRNTTF